MSEEGGHAHGEGKGKIITIITLIATLLMIGGYLGYNEYIKEKVHEPVNVNMTIMIEQKIVDGLTKIHEKQKDFILCGYGKYVTNQVILIDRVDECTSSDYVAVIVAKSDDSCKMSVDEFKYLYSNHFVGMVCKEEVKFYNAESMSEAYRQVNEGKI